MTETIAIEELATEEVTVEKLSISSPFVLDRGDSETIKLCVGEGKPCIHNPQVGYRVLHTQERGKVLSVPRVVGYFETMFNTDELLSQYRQNGSYAIMSPLYDCGHDALQWTEFWR
jgi:hypothetical protein